MIRFRRAKPNESRYVEASPEDIRSMRRFVRSTLWDLNIHHDDAEDIAQNVEFITWKALEERRIREHSRRNAFNCLRLWMNETAWRLGKNHKRLYRHRYEARIEADLATEHDPRLDARELLERLTAYPEVLALLVLLATGGMRKEGAKASGVYLKGYQARLWLRRVRDSGIWCEPPGHEKPTPKHRKGKR